MGRSAPNEKIELRRISKISERILSAYSGINLELHREDVYMTEKSVIVRFRLRNRRRSVPDSVVTKQFVPYPADRASASVRFITECAALKFLSGIASKPLLCPRYYGADSIARVIVMEDLGTSYKDTTYQLVRGSNPDRAEAAMIAHVAAIGRLHARTIGSWKDYGSVRAALGKTDDQSGLFQKEWPTVEQTKTSKTEINFVSRRYAHQFQKLGIRPQTGYDGEIAVVVAEVERHIGQFFAFCQGDQMGPGGAIYSEGQQRFYDFDCSGFRHALLEGAPGRTTWGCVMGIPQRLAAQMEKVYRTLLAKSNPCFNDGAVFDRAFVAATARWHLFYVLHRLNRCLAEDFPRGPTTRRQQYLAWLDLFGGMTEEFGYMSALGRSARAMAARLRKYWPVEVHSLPLYPAFRNSVRSSG